MDALTPEMCRRVRELGFSGIFTRFRKNDPNDTPKAKADRVRQVLADNGIHMYQAHDFWQNLVTPDDNHRKESVKSLQNAMRLAGWMGAWRVDAIPGSMNPAGPWFPHPDNWTPSSRRQLVKSLKECAPAAQDAGVIMGIEGHQLVVLESAEVTRDILAEVDSPWVRNDYDSANWITRETVYNTSAAINHHFDVLGPYIVSCHAKDIGIENRLTLHLQDGCPGKGLLDFRTLFRRMEALSPEYPVIAEGNSTEELPFVSDLFHRTAKELDIKVID
jgi:sugar phosphate isomerase/epimerase